MINNVKSKWILFILVVSMVFSITGCKQEHDNSTGITFSYSTVRHIEDNGWVYTCSYFFNNDGTVDDSVPPVTFSVINLRHRYGTPMNTKNPIQMLGDGVSEETDRDMEKIAAFLGYGKHGMKALEIEEIMAKDRNSLELEVVDKELFFELLDKAVNGEAVPVGRYIEHPSYALLCEPAYLDGYCFQIGYMVEMGCIDVMMIDVLYADSNTETGYRQLSDMIEDGTATEEQKELYNTLEAISAGIVENNSYLYGKKEHGKTETADVELKRLYSFLADLEENNYGEYVVFGY